jgi:hypothetical protein
MQRIESVCNILLTVNEENSKAFIEDTIVKRNHLQDHIKQIEEHIIKAKRGIKKELDFLTRALGKGQSEESRVNQSPEESIKTVDRNPYSYMIGKIAGEEVLDKSGDTIIKKNETITSDHIQQSQQEGKLTELIINMIIPNVDEIR